MVCILVCNQDYVLQLLLNEKEIRVFINAANSSWSVFLIMLN